MTQFPNHLLKSGVSLIGSMDQSINYINQPPLPQFVPTQQNTPLNQSISMNGGQKPQTGKDTSK